MDPASLIVGALVAGATTGVGDSAAEAVRDSYEYLKELVRSKLADRQDAEQTLQRLETNPQGEQDHVVAMVNKLGIGADDPAVAVATQLMSLVDPSGAAAGTYIVSSKGVQVGNWNTQINRFS